MDWFSRYVLSWALSATLEAGFCRGALEAARTLGRPDIFNTDQGAQFTALEFTATLRQHQIQICRDSRRRWLEARILEINLRRLLRKKQASPKPGAATL